MAQWLLLHGTPLGPEVWREVGPLLARPAEVLRPDVPAVDAEDGAQAAAARQVLAQLPDDGSRLHVVGHSFGGQVALELALAAPGRVASLTVLCSRATPFPPFAALADALRCGDPVDVDAALARWFRPDEVAADPWAVRYARGRLAGADRASWATALAAIAAYDATGRLGALAVPVTLVAAALDPVSPPEAMADLAARVPDGRLHVLPDAAHMSPLVRAAELVGLLQVRARADRASGRMWTDPVRSARRAEVSRRTGGLR